MKLFRDMGCKNWLDVLANLAEIVVLCVTLYVFIVMLSVAAAPIK